MLGELGLELGLGLEVVTSRHLSLRRLSRSRPMAAMPAR